VNVMAFNFKKMHSFDDTALKCNESKYESKWRIKYI